MGARDRELPPPADVHDYVRLHRAIPILPRTAQAKRLTDRQFRELAEYINKNP